MIASEYDSVKCAELLLVNGANINYIDDVSIKIIP